MMKCIYNNIPFENAVLMCVEDGFKPQRAYVSNLRGECLKHKASMFETFPGGTFSAFELRLFFKNGRLVI